MVFEVNDVFDTASCGFESSFMMVDNILILVAQSSRRARNVTVSAAVCCHAVKFKERE